MSIGPRNERHPAAAGIAVLGLAAALLAVTAVGLDRATTLRATWPAEADVLYLPSSATLRHLALGHTELGADLVAARANVYFGTQLSAKAPQKHLERYLTTAADLDPGFHRLYFTGAAMLVYNGRQITVEAVESAIAYLKRGMAVFPSDWELRFHLGFNQFFELPGLADKDDARVPAWRQSGLEALRQVTLFDGVPAWLPNLVARLLTKRGEQDLAIRHLEQAYAATSSEDTRNQIRLKLAQLHQERGAQRVEDEQQALDKLLMQGYSYAPESFTIIAGPRRRPGVNLDAVLEP